MSLKTILKSQYDYAEAKGWLPYFIDAASKYSFTVADLMAVASRESNMRNIRGDYHSGEYHGFSLMQLDINSYREWIEAGKWEDVGEAIRKGSECLAEKRAQIVKTSKLKTAHIKFRSGKTVSFTPRPLDDMSLRHCVLAAYNCGGASYYHYSVGNDIDSGTTGKNYGRDVIQRSAFFQEFLDSREAAAPEGAPAEVSSDTDVDLLGAAVKSDQVKEQAKSLTPRLLKHSGAGLAWISAMYELHKLGTIIVLLIVFAGIAWMVYHNRAWLKQIIAKALK